MFFSSGELKENRRKIAFMQILRTVKKQWSVRKARHETKMLIGIKVTVILGGNLKCDK